MSRDYGAEYRKRQARAQASGFRSYSAQRNAQKARLDPLAEEARRRALEAVALMRREGLSLSAAARKASTTPTTVRRYAGSALEQSGRTVRAKPTDRLRRKMRVLTPTGPASVTVTSSARASLVGRHWDAIGVYLNTGDTEPLSALRTPTVAGVELVTDPDVIDELARRGGFDFSSIYSRVS
jgi:hypothetical protein